MSEVDLRTDPGDYRLHRLRGAFAQAVHPPQDVSRFLLSECCDAPVYLAEQVLLIRARIVRCAGCLEALYERYDDQDTLPKACLP